MGAPYIYHISHLRIKGCSLYFKVECETLSNLQFVLSLKCLFLDDMW